MNTASFRHLDGRADMSIERSDITDFSKLNLRSGRIYYRLYRQDGSMQDMDCEDTRYNRLCVSWMQVHDRWLPVNADPRNPGTSVALA